MSRSRLDNRVIRALLPALAVAAALVSGASVESTSAANAVWATSQGPQRLIGVEPWQAAFEISAAFGADDAYVFADAAASTRLDSGAIAVAVRIDQERLTQTAGASALHSASDGRIAAAFGGFVAVGPEGLAYASLGLVRGEAGATQVARAPTPSLLAMLPLR